MYKRETGFLRGNIFCCLFNGISKRQTYCF